MQFSGSNGTKKNEAVAAKRTQHCAQTQTKITSLDKNVYAAIAPCFLRGIACPCRRRKQPAVARVFGAFIFYIRVSFWIRFAMYPASISGASSSDP